ncbi:Hsp90 cochaperone, variant 2 [Umbelopsis sp. WA50703]
MLVETKRVLVIFIAVQFEQEKFEDCIKTCEEAVEVGRDNRADYKLIARAYQRIGSAYSKLNELDQAIRFFEKSLTEHRTPETLAKLREAEKLKKDLEKQAYHNPELGEKAREEGNALFKKNDWPGAVAQYTEAIKRNEQDYKSYSNRAACYLKLLAINEALKDAEKCIEIEPTFVRGHLRKAAVDFARKEYEDCIEACKEAQKYDTDGKSSREIQQQIQKAYAAMNPYSGGNSDESQEEVLKRAAQDPEVQRILGDPVMQQILQQMQQDPKAAQEHLKNPQVAANIRRLMSAGILKMA